MLVSPAQSTLKKAVLVCAQQGPPMEIQVAGLNLPMPEAFYKTIRIKSINEEIKGFKTFVFEAGQLPVVLVAEFAVPVAVALEFLDSRQ